MSLEEFYSPYCARKVKLTIKQCLYCNSGVLLHAESRFTSKSVIVERLVMVLIFLWKAEEKNK